MTKRKSFIHPNAPLFQPDHPRPRTRREFIAQGFCSGFGAVAGMSTLGSMLLSSKAKAQSQINTLEELKGYITTRSGNEGCNLDGGSNLKIPFICIDLAGGANMAGSNVLVGGPGGQEDFLSTAGYNKQGLPGDMVPNPDLAGSFINSELGLKFHSQSAFLAGIMGSTTQATRDNTDGAVIPSRSENDTGNNPHNPMYGIARIAKAKGSLLNIIGSRNSASGGNSMAPSDLILPDLQPTKIDRPSDVTGLVDVGDFGSLDDKEIVAVMATMSRLSDDKLEKLVTGVSNEEELIKKVSCAYVEMAKATKDFPPDKIDERLDPLEDLDIQTIFPGLAESSGVDKREFLKAASVMKLVIDGPPPDGDELQGGYAGAGTITMGGYDYHGNSRSSTEVRDLRAGRVMGACLEYARLKNKPLMLYVFSDGSISSNGQIDERDQGGNGKPMWTSDNQQTGASFFLVYNPNGRPQLKDDGPGRQIGHMRASGDVDTLSSPGANNVNQLVQMVILNYMALHDEQDVFAANYGLVSENLGIDPSNIDSLIAFQNIVDGTIRPV